MERLVDAEYASAVEAAYELLFARWMAERNGQRRREMEDELTILMAIAQRARTPEGPESLSPDLLGYRGAS